MFSTSPTLRRRLRLVQWPYLVRANGLFVKRRSDLASAAIALICCLTELGLCDSVAGRNRFALGRPRAGGVLLGAPEVDANSLQRAAFGGPGARSGTGGHQFDPFTVFVNSSGAAAACPLKLSPLPFIVSACARVRLAASLADWSSRRCVHAIAWRAAHSRACARSRPDRRYPRLRPLRANFVRFKDPERPSKTLSKKYRRKKSP